MKTIFVNITDDNSAVDYYRALLPAKFCGSEELKFTCSKSLDSLDYDVFYISRAVKPHLIPVMEELKKHGKLVYGLDDDVWHLPEWNPAAKVYDDKVLDACNWMRDNADFIVVSTEPLKAVVDRPEKTFVLPNLVDLEAWPAVERNHRDFRVLWSGSLHHQKDLDLIVEPLEAILKEFDNVTVLFMGDMPDAMASYARIRYSHLARMIPSPKYGGKVGFIPPVSLSSYPSTLCEIAPDVGLAPLCSDRFNRSKSNIKFLEYTLAGAVTVASDLEPYRHALQDGDVFLASDWYDVIKFLIKSPKWARNMNRSSRELVKNEWSWQHSKYKQDWINFFEAI